MGEVLFGSLKPVNIYFHYRQRQQHECFDIINLLYS